MQYNSRGEKSLTLSTENYKVVKAFNNNVLLVTLNGKERILLSKGIGFGKTANDSIPIDTPIDKVFTIEDEVSSDRFSQLVSSVDSNVIGLCEEVIFMIGSELKEELNEKIHISLTDHISFMLSRLKENNEILNPFLVETETLYKQEFEIAKKAIKQLESRLNIKIPEGEIGFITLHIHTARNQGKLSNSVKNAYLISRLAEVIETSFDIVIDRRSIDYARFVTHLRFAIERLQNGKPIRNELLSVIKRQFKESYKLSEKLAKLIEENINTVVAKDEIAYITIHVEKFRKKDDLN
jgi:transcriptional antiterminator